MNPRSLKLARIVETIGTDYAPTDPEQRRRERAARVQAAWLRSLSAASDARRQLGGETSASAVRPLR